MSETTRLGIDPAMTVNETIARFPTTVRVFNAFGVDACCGGDASVAEAAERDGVPLDALVQGLADEVGSAGAEGKR